ncbi:hypothetical protein BTZ20_0192 [Rhodococcus sp. MTM3W5.2]|nr:hypothetical protein BTZ20_0192 [Rhodococcus sp. MTM3W5.2]
MNEQQVGDSLPDQEHHEGGFRPMSELINAREEHGADITRGGPHYGEFIEQVRGLMDRARLASPPTSWRWRRSACSSNSTTSWTRPL